MTESERALDRASKHSSLAVLGMAAATSVALFGPPFFIPLVSLPLWGLGVAQRLTEKPWLAAGAIGWGAAVALLFGSPVVGVASAAGAVFFVRHWLLIRRLRSELPPGAARPD